MARQRASVAGTARSPRDERWAGRRTGRGRRVVPPTARSTRASPRAAATRRRVQVREASRPAQGVAPSGRAWRRATAERGRRRARVATVQRPRSRGSACSGGTARSARWRYRSAQGRTSASRRGEMAATTSPRCQRLLAGTAGRCHGSLPDGRMAPRVTADVDRGEAVREGIPASSAPGSSSPRDQLGHAPVAARGDHVERYVLVERGNRPAQPDRNEVGPDQVRQAFDGRSELDQPLRALGRLDDRVRGQDAGGPIGAGDASLVSPTRGRARDASRPRVPEGPETLDRPQRHRRQRWCWTLATLHPL